VIESTDRVQHMMYRLIDDKHPWYDPALAAKHGDAILRVYRRADQFVAQVMEILDPGTTIMIVSDHGSTPGASVNLNTWLVEKGYMVLNNQPAPARKNSTICLAAARTSKTSTGRRRARLRDGPRPDLFQPARPRRPGHRQSGRRYTALADELANRLKRELVDPRTA
jgi:predicted AlkP superfamily phosphohydrolase/phosphomutase